MKARLFVLAGPEIGRSFDLRHGDTLGRSPDCIVTLRHASVSRHHAHIEVEGDAFWVVDDASRNGVHAGGKRVERLRLSDQMEFALGELSLRIRLEGSADSAAADRSASPGQPAVPPLHPGTPPAAAGDDASRVLGQTTPDGSSSPSPASPPSPPRAAPSPPPRPPAQEPGWDDGITIEAPDEIEIAPRRAAAPAPMPASVAAAQQQAAPKTEGDRVLQYHRVPNVRGFAVADLSQHPLWVRWSVYALVLALAGALFFAAFKGTAFLRGKARAPADSAAVGDQGRGGATRGQAPALREPTELQTSNQRRADASQL